MKISREDYLDSWILTFSGNKFWPLDPRAEEVTLKDIAHALAMKCRFTGQCIRFYSVAEHSILASRLVPPEFAAEALMHDAAEAYLPDVAGPIKPLLKGFKKIEEQVEYAIWKRFNLHIAPNHPTIKAIDRRLVVTERDRNMAKGPTWDTHTGIEPYHSLEFPFWSPYAAELQFLQRAKELGLK